MDDAQRGDVSQVLDGWHQLKFIKVFVNMFYFIFCIFVLYIFIFV